MDAFFGGLDSRLRASVKAADSIMVGLVNAAMEDAYQKSLWKDGDLERLFHKLRFAELALMQLDWCLRFVRGEMEAAGDGNGGEADGGGDDAEANGDGDGGEADDDDDDDEGQEQLLDDLLETRDRIQDRLDEAELAVAQADSDYMRRKRDELELDPSRRRDRDAAAAPSAAIDRRGGATEAEGGAFAELRGSVSRKMSRMRARLEEASSELAALMQRVCGDASPMARLQEPGDGDGVKGVSGFYGMAQLLMELQEMVLDVGAVRDCVASAFDAVERSVSGQREAMEEQRWLLDAEKEMYGAVVEGFLREINVESTKCNHPHPGGEGCPAPTLHHSRGATATENSSDEFQSLKDGTSELQSARLIPAEKSEQSTRCCNSEEHRISQEEAERLTERTIDSEIRCQLQHVLYSSVFRDLSRKLSLQEHDAEKVTEQRDEMEIRSNLQYEVHSIIFKDLVKNLGSESVDHLIKTSIEDEVHTTLLKKTTNAWKINTEMVHNERLIKEEMDRIVFGGLINDLVNGQNLSVVKYQHQNRPNQGRFGMINSTEQLEKGKIQVNVTNIYEVLMEFEAITCGKIGATVLRLRDLDKQLSNLIEQVNSLKTSEIIYRKAFTRRCYDLQTAEAEVDLLGDEVELLLGLLSKTYQALDHYSPVLQHYVRIKEMLNLLGKELAARLQHPLS